MLIDHAPRTGGTIGTVYLFQFCGKGKIVDGVLKMERVGVTPSS
jgi:hypothetical protein